jgi:hypothetical protein
MISGNSIAVVPASVTISLTGMTGTPTMIHLHGPAFFGPNVGVLVTLCSSATTACNSLSGTSFTQTFSGVNWPINVAAAGNTYFNVHTTANGGGEARGQVVTTTNPPTSVNGGKILTFYTDSLCTMQPSSSVAASLPLIGNSSFTALNIPVWNTPNPLVTPLNTCTPSGSRFGSNGQNVKTYALVSQCSSQGAGAIAQVFLDSTCTTPFAPAELIPASEINTCIQLIPPIPNIVPTGLYAMEACGGAVKMTVPLSAYQENVAIAPFAFIATPGQQIPVPSQACANATFSVTFNPAAGANSTSFTAITITGGLTGPLTSVHIHGPCPTTAPCNAGVIYWICGSQGAPSGVSACPSGTNPTIPAFVVNSAQNANADNSLLLGLLQGILSGNNLYYVNFHTAA